MRCMWHICRDSNCCPDLTTKTYNFEHVAFAVQDDKIAEDDAASIDIVNTSAHPSKPGTPASWFPLPLPNSAARTDEKSLMPYLQQGKSQPGKVQHVATNVQMQDGSAGPCAFKPPHTGRGNSAGLAPFVRQAAPMVLCLDNLAESSEEVLDMELRNKLGAMSLEELQRLNAML